MIAWPPGKRHTHDIHTYVHTYIQALIHTLKIKKQVNLKNCDEYEEFEWNVFQLKDSLFWVGETFKMIHLAIESC